MNRNLKDLKRELSCVQGVAPRVALGAAITLVVVLPFVSTGFLVLMLAKWWIRNS
jgi:hypothetical protein